MKTYYCGLSPGLSSKEASERWQIIADWWSRLHVENDSGATTWEVLDSIESQVMECRTRVPPELPKAESLTFKAALLIDGGCND